MIRKKIYYIPGTISFVALPLLLLLLLPKENKHALLHAVKFMVPSDSKPSSIGNIYLIKDYFYRSIKGKKIIEINLNEEPLPNESYLFNARLHFISREIETLEFTNDTSSIIKIKLGAANTYGHFFWVLNQALIYKLRRYGLVDDSFYLFANPPPGRFSSSQ